MLYRVPPRSITATETELTFKPNNILQGLQWVISNEEYTLRMALQLAPMSIEKKAIVYTYMDTNPHSPILIEYESPGAFNRISSSSVPETWGIPLPQVLTPKEARARIFKQERNVPSLFLTLFLFLLMALFFYFLGEILLYTARTNEALHLGTCQSECAYALMKQTLLFLFPFVISFFVVVPFIAPTMLLRKKKRFYPLSSSFKVSVIVYVLFASLLFFDESSQGRTSHYFENVKKYLNGDLRIDKRPEQ
jgi:hypothetical protein